MKTLGALAAILLFLLALRLASWAAFDGSYTALLGVTKEASVSFRVFAGVLAALGVTPAVFLCRKLVKRLDPLSDDTGPNDWKQR